jgi:hypothetical protein
MRIVPGRWRLLLEIGALLCVTFPVVVSGEDRGRSAEMATCVGTLLSIDGEKRTCTVEKSNGSVDTFRLDDNATLIFQGMRPLRIGELHPGMRIEVDRRRAAGEGLPTVTWVEVLEEKQK